MLIEQVACQMSRKLGKPAWFGACGAARGFSLSGGHARMQVNF